MQMSRLPVYGSFGSPATCRPISHRNLARMKLAPLGSGSITLLNADGRRQILGPIDVSDHPGVADWNLHERGLVRGDEMARALVAAERNQLFVERAPKPHRMPAPRAEVRRGEARAGSERVAHRGD